MKDLTAIYPFNLAKSIFGNETEAMKIYIPGIEQAFATLTEREVRIIRRRFEDLQTLQGVGQEEGISRERVRQIEAKAIRKLRHPSRKKIFKAVPISEIQEQGIEYQKLSQEYELLAKAFEEITKTPASPEVLIPIAELAVTLQTPISELDLTVRSYNCLKRAGKETLRDIAEMTEDELLRVRNLGRKSAVEVVDCLKKYGLELRGGLNHDA